MDYSPTCTAATISGTTHGSAASVALSDVEVGATAAQSCSDSAFGRWVASTAQRVPLVAAMPWLEVAALAPPPGGGRITALMSWAFNGRHRLKWSRRRVAPAWLLALPHVLATPPAPPRTLEGNAPSVVPAALACTPTTDDGEPHGHVIKLPRSFCVGQDLSRLPYCTTRNRRPPPPPPPPPPLPSPPRHCFSFS